MSIVEQQLLLTTWQILGILVKLDVYQFQKTGITGLKMGLSLRLTLVRSYEKIKKLRLKLSMRLQTLTNAQSQIVVIP